MRKTLPLSTDWYFKQNVDSASHAPKKAGRDFAAVTLPHTWNALDGQDGGFDYARCASWYNRTVRV